MDWISRPQSAAADGTGSGTRCPSFQALLFEHEYQLMEYQHEYDKNQ